MSAVILALALLAAGAQTSSAAEVAVEGDTLELGDGNDSFSPFDDAYAHGLVVLGGAGDDELAGHASEARRKTLDGGPGNDHLSRSGDGR